MEFIETDVFTKRIADILTDDEYRALQEKLVQDPKAGKLILHGKGLRKYRWKMQGQGKSSGARIIYYLYSSEFKIYLLFPYKKSEQGDLTKDQLKVLIHYVREGIL